MQTTAAMNKVYIPTENYTRVMSNQQARQLQKLCRMIVQHDYQEHPRLWDDLTDAVLFDACQRWTDFDPTRGKSFDCYINKFAKDAARQEYNALTHTDTISVDETGIISTDDDDALTLADTLADPDTAFGYDHEMMPEEKHQKEMKAMKRKLAKLKSKEREVLLIFASDKSIRTSDVAKQLGVTKKRVAQIRHMAKAKIIYNS